MADDSLERIAWDDGVCLYGVDEAGAGNLAGSCFISAVAFPINFDFSKMKKMNDSKKLTDVKRFAFESVIRDCASIIIEREISPETIDADSVYHARLNVMRDSLNDLQKTAAHVYFDGNVAIPGLSNGMLSRYLVKGDSKCLSIAAASIISKCNQRRQMLLLHEEYPGYDFSNNNGYFSEKHANAIKTIGPTPVHRKMYTRNILGEL